MKKEPVGRVEYSQQRSQSILIGGVHLSGANTSRTSLVVLGCDLDFATQTPLLRLVALHDRLGPKGKVFSDDRLMDILSPLSNLKSIFVDTPLSYPPCTVCPLMTCPGVSSCEDVSVAYMGLFRQKRHDRAKDKKVLKPINPQVQRLFDFYYEHRFGVSWPYSAANASVVTRALTFKKRVKNACSHIDVEETQVPLVLSSIKDSLGFKENIDQSYRNFEKGKLVRRSILTALQRDHWVELGNEDFAAISSSVECFQAFISAFAGVCHQWGLSWARPTDYVEKEGWPYIPQLSSKVPVHKLKKPK